MTLTIWLTLKKKGNANTNLNKKGHAGTALRNVEQRLEGWRQTWTENVFFLKDKKTTFCSGAPEENWRGCVPGVTLNSHELYLRGRQ